MNTKRTLSIIVCCIVAALICVHIRYLCWERSCFAVGGEWLVYAIAIVATVWRFADDD